MSDWISELESRLCANHAELWFCERQAMPPGCPMCSPALETAQARIAELERRITWLDPDGIIDDPDLESASRASLLEIMLKAAASEPPHE